jgi:hypothetical protein
MTTPDLERRIRTWFADEIGEAEAAPSAVYAFLGAIPQSLPREQGLFGRRTFVLLAAAVLLVGLVAGAIAVGSGLLKLPSILPPTASPEATFPGPSQSAAPSASPIPVAGPGGVWIPTGSMVTPRYGHDAVRLLDGRVLVVGGSGGEFDPATAELYDPVSGTWSATGNMLNIRAGLPPVLLLDGRVLVGDVVDGTDGDPDIYGSELYDPATGTWTATGPMVGDSPGDAPTVLRDGRVLVVGGDGPQLYDPATGTWTATGKMNDQGYHTTAGLLSDGKVLVAGGSGFTPINHDYYVLDSAQVYDPVTGSWTTIANMHAKASITAAFLQPDGTVLVVGSLVYYTFPARIHAEVYDPATGTWTALAQPTGSNGFMKIEALLSDGTVLMTDPDEDKPGPGPAAECTAAALYDPRTGSTTTASSMLRCVDGSSFTLLPDGTVLKAGGRDCNDEGQCISNGTAELYVPAGVSLPPFSFPPPTCRSSRARPRSRRRSRPRPVPFRRTLGPGPSRSTTRAPSPRRCSSPGTG